MERSVDKSANGFFGEAYDLSYTDIYDLSSDKKSLKKLEIEYGVHHQKLRLPLDEPAPEDIRNLVAEYCKNDMIATQLVWDKHRGNCNV